MWLFLAFLGGSVVGFMVRPTYEKLREWWYELEDHDPY